MSQGFDDGALRGITYRSKNLNRPPPEDMTDQEATKECQISEDPVLTGLRRKLNNLNTDLDGINEAGITAVHDTSQVPTFRGMYRRAEGLYNRFMTLYEELIDAVSPAEPLELDQFARSQAISTYDGINTIAETLQINRPDTFALNNTLSPSNSSRTKAKLPTITVPPFDGRQEKWQRFKDTFESLVINDGDLSQIDRFHYLVASLQGTASALIAQLPITEANFAIAWQVLLDNYDNPRLLATAYLDQLVSLKPLSNKPSTEQLKQLTAQLTEWIAAFQKINIADRADFLLFYLARRVLDLHTRESFELLQKENTFPTCDSLISFLRQRCTASALAVGISHNTLPYESKYTPANLMRPTNSASRVKVLVASPEIKPKDSRPSKGTCQRGSNAHSSESSPHQTYTHAPCPVCKEKHPLVRCPRFNSMGVKDRLACLNTWTGCRICLFPSHTSNKCVSRQRCLFCRGRGHHSLIHYDPIIETSETSHSSQYERDSRGFHSQGKRNPHPSTNVLNVTAFSSQIVIGTAVCHILDSQGKLHPIRLAMDSGSQFSFLSRRLAIRLGLKIQMCDVSILGIGQTPMTGFRGRTKCRLVSRLEPAEVSTQVLVVDNITSELPSSVIPESSRLPYQAYKLADPDFWQPGPIEFLLGGDLFADVLTGDIVTINPGQPKLIGTIFGYVIIGRMPDLSAAQHVQALCATAKTSLSHKDDLKDDLQRLWQLEEPPSVKVDNPQDILCEEHFNATHYRLSTGRYVVSLPFKEPKPTFPPTRWMAIKRLSHVEGKLIKSTELRELYSGFMKEYEELGHMVSAKEPGKYLIPHHGVVKEEEGRRKIRVVFDASAKTSIGSLNDYLYPGPKLQNSIVDILLNFRQFEYSFTVDMVKMYRQILIHPPDRVYQHVLWRPDPSCSVDEFELCTVTYGQSCAPYLALRTVKQLIVDEGNAYPLAAEAIQHHMYVDDLATGAHSMEEALELQRQVIALMKKGEFTLSKWKSNVSQLLASVGETNESVSVPHKIEDPEDKVRVKILGLQWNPRTDTFGFEVTPPEPCFTKRSILASVSRIYDPLGFLGPVVISAKALIQQAWKLGLDWDQVFPSSLQARWRLILEQLPRISELRIPRWIYLSGASSCDLLVFGDASEKAYCAAAYLRVKIGCKVKVRLLLSKTKLAPVKPVSIPRLELCAALLASKLVELLTKLIQKLPHRPRLYMFSDSTVVLGWLNNPPHELQTFVANRVVRILQVTKAEQWYHVRSEDNPSDLGSRGIEVNDLIYNELWFNGPYWALLETDRWPIEHSQNSGNNPDNLPERKKSHIVLATAVEDPLLIQLISSFSTLMSFQRTLAWVQRFIYNCRTPPKHRLHGPLHHTETEKVLSMSVKVVQQFYLNQCKPLSADVPKHLEALHPFIDSDGILRVGGRLKYASLPYAARHPYILPAKVPLTSLIIDHYHRILMHPGPTLLLSMIRRKFWILGARNAIRQYSLNCIKCRRLLAAPCQPIMADIPPHRLQEGRAFTNVGVDFAGPFIIRESLRRKAQQSKCYMCLFICLGSRAIHLEAVSAVSTPAFRAAFERFVSRRGLPKIIFSDNGTNFLGAANELKNIVDWFRNSATQYELVNFATAMNISWKFIPPHAPHWGGSWEAGVRSAKRLLRTVYGEGAFTYEELSTMLARIEAILNSRPICPLSSDPEDIDALTPGHLLIGSPLVAHPEHSLLHLKEGRLSRWQIVQQRTQLFWKRWKTECLHELQLRNKWRKPQRNLEISDLVLIRGDDTCRLKWPLGRITEVFPGPDGVVRVAAIQTAKGIIKRPASKLIVLLPQNINSDG